mmetsp:Transcript_56806/g.133782  ORF Transcript_56806/g.133782 Transcript_56806/m.133782 type:complete len:209 (+) Transcript_56806:611-1237(+)
MCSRVSSYCSCGSESSGSRMSGYVYAGGTTDGPSCASSELGSSALRRHPTSPSSSFHCLSCCPLMVARRAASMRWCAAICFSDSFASSSPRSPSNGSSSGCKCWAASLALAAVPSSSASLNAAVWPTFLVLYEFVCPIAFPFASCPLAKLLKTTPLCLLIAFACSWSRVEFPNPNTIPMSVSLFFLSWMSLFLRSLAVSLCSFVFFFF